ncbi:beta-microseminoprotein-like [Esox lucius]|uniref:Beta-microseminoprotein n=1 Tax=Esox lucius TaxID=8010 RepID=A0AAY5K6H5_ESOLU|nr:beta-microseminoprotein-like [Esox lucius]
MTLRERKHKPRERRTSHANLKGRDPYIVTKLSLAIFQVFPHAKLVERYLALAVILCSVLPLSHAAGFQQAEPGDGIKQCLDTKDGTWHAIGSRWRTSDCMDCSCLDNGEMSCCPAYSTPTMFPSDCMKEFDQKACQFNVFKKGDRSVPCPIYNMEGKC